MDMLSQMSGSLRSPACRRRALLTDSITEGASDIARLSVSPLFQKNVGCLLIHKFFSGKQKEIEAGKLLALSEVV